MKWIAAVLFVLFLAWVFDLGLVVYAMLALLAALVLSHLITRAWSEQLAARRRCNQLVADIGDTVTVSLTVENRGWLPIIWLLLEDLLPPESLRPESAALRVVGRRLEVMTLWPYRSKTIFYQLECRRRGYYQIGPLVIETGDLFGLHRRYLVMSEPNYLLVYPRCIPLAGYDIASRRPIGEVRLTHRLYEDPTRIAGVREYQAGDPLNRIHWRATAATGKLHSKVFEPSTIAGATLLVDFHRHAYDPRQEPVRSDLAVTAAASIANALYEMGQQIGLVTNGRDAADRIRTEGWVGDARTRDVARQSAQMLASSDRLQPVIVPTRRGPEQFMQLLTALARLELTDGLPLPQLIQETTSRMPHDASVIVLLPRVSWEDAVALGGLKRQGYAVTAIINTYEDEAFADAAGRLLAQGIDSRHLKDESSITTICQAYVVQ